MENVECFHQRGLKTPAFVDYPQLHGEADFFVIGQRGAGEYDCPSENAPADSLL